LRGCSGCRHRRRLRLIHRRHRRLHKAA
jgi:hypothetical protein